MTGSVETRKYQPSWESLKQYSVPQWYQDAKFGIFIHWGPYCVPAFGNEWYPRNMYVQGSREYQHHLETYGPQAQFGYKDFLPMFRAEHYDPAYWASLFKRSGARYVVPVAEHHDGFAMYDSALSTWTAARKGPKRDLVGELAAAVRAEGMVFGVSSHRAEHWWFMNGGRDFDSDVQDPALADFYGPAQPYRSYPRNIPPLDAEPWPDAAYLEDWLARACELVDKYRPQVVWFDWWIDHPAFEPYLAHFAVYYYNRGEEWGQGVAINYKNSSYPEGTAVLDLERGQLKDIRPMLWQNDTSVSKNSWGYIEGHDYKTPRAIVQDLVDVVSKNGCLLLNIGPRADGTIPEVEQEMLLEIGRWLALNGEAIYDTRPWHVFGEGPTEVPEGMFMDTQRSPFTAEDFRFTCTDRSVYAICLDWPHNEVCIRSLGSGSSLADGAIASIHLLGIEDELAWRQDAAGLHIVPPGTRPCDHAYTFSIMLR